MAEQAEGVVRIPSRVEDWLDALESGKYLQGFRSLQESGRFCTLGVALDLYVQAGYGDWRQSYHRPELSMFLSKHDEQRILSLIDQGIIVAPGDAFNGGAIYVDDTLIDLVVLNDVDKLSFKDTARKIREGYVREKENIDDCTL